MSESAYLSNSNLLNRYVVPKYFATPQRSEYVSLANLFPKNFEKNIEIVNSFLLCKGLYEIKFLKNGLSLIFQF